MTEDQTPDPPKGEVVPQHVVDILRFCMRQYGVYHELTTDDLQTVTIEDLVTWCLKEKYPISCSDQICETTYSGTGNQPAGSKITPLAVEMVWSQLQSPYAAVKLLMPIWPWISEKRPPLDIRPLQMSITLSFIFRDQTAMQIAVPTDLQDKPVSNGFLCALAYDQMINIVQSLAVNGIDALREKYAEPCEVPPGTEGEFTQK